MEAKKDSASNDNSDNIRPNMILTFVAIPVTRKSTRTTTINHLAVMYMVDALWNSLPLENNCAASRARKRFFLLYIENEYRYGLCSKLLIGCHKCLILNEVETCKCQPTQNHRMKHNGFNLTAALGITHSGGGYDGFKKMLACMDIPCFTFRSFTAYEKIIGLAAEFVAKDTYKEATILERKLTIEDAKILTEQL